MVVFHLLFTRIAEETLDALQDDPSQADRVLRLHKAFARMEHNPRHPALHSEPVGRVSDPPDAELWRSHADLRPSGPWTYSWLYGPKLETLVIVLIKEHPG